MKISRILKAVDKFNETLKESGSTRIINLEVDTRTGQVLGVSVVSLPVQRLNGEKVANTPEKRASRAENSPEDFSSAVDGQAGPSFTEAVQAASKRREALQISPELRDSWTTAAATMEKRPEGYSWATASASQIIEDIQNHKRQYELLRDAAAIEDEQAQEWQFTVTDPRSWTEDEWDAAAKDSKAGLDTPEAQAYKAQRARAVGMQAQRTMEGTLKPWTPDGGFQAELDRIEASHVQAAAKARSEVIEQNAQEADKRDFAASIKPKATPLLIGAGGLKGAGKDALSDYLVEHHDFVKLGMSDTLAKALLILNPWIKVTDKDVQGNNELVYALMVQGWAQGFHRYADLEAALGYTLAKTIEEVRVSLQRLGTDVGRALISDTVWVDISRRCIEEQLAAGRSVIITGMRFHNELVMIEELGGHTLWVNRPSKASAAENVLTEPEALKTSPASAQHASEVTLSSEDFRHHVQNGGTLADLYQAGNRIVATLSQEKPPAYNSVEADIIWPSYDH